MFFKRAHKQVNGQFYEYWALCESVPTDKGPRQRIVARLGKLAGDDPHEEAGWEDLQVLLEGRPVEKQPSLGQASSGRKESAGLGPTPGAASGTLPGVWPQLSGAGPLAQAGAVQAAG